MNIQLRQGVKRNFASIQHSFFCKHSGCSQLLAIRECFLICEKRRDNSFHAELRSAQNVPAIVCEELMMADFFIKPVIIQRAAVMRDSLLDVN
ncbi:hypothetical protein CEXT_378461 [Caerostris extrusa]|uniref:Uncharacterized protein n=1 Tax=Caerostris extrusa TaxID=172846 RepID=A0AAV4PIZ6_CAEEX|nr:hypothetical protein CEXT_378461 [Caerostris extrusa]